MELFYWLSSFVYSNTYSNTYKVHPLNDIRIDIIDYKIKNYHKGRKKRLMKKRQREIKELKQILNKY
tara:strand:- start:1619 stop:1819 length:201 start_codon:yes stop_codon:yes gene_type:complete